MADFEAIRRGLAANLRTLEDCVVSPWLLPEISKKSLSVAGPETLDYMDGAFGDDASDRGATLFMVVEGAAPLIGGLRAAQLVFDDWLLWQVPEAIEADIFLTSRLQNNGSILTDQDPACDALQVREFRGYRPISVDGTDALVGDWLVELRVSG